ncbi:MAG: hypothetical protein H6936_09360 [Burkholderiales bacterium]|nr:hypothetical protein [Nitrosomonas sp.]MCP5275040.1 hypothetical protein [Burkholderiales bacterium]
MSMESEFKAKFGGFWNSLVILLVIIICLRFSSIELAEEDLGTRLACSLQLFLACIGAGIVLGILRIFLSFSNDTYTRAPASANFTSGIRFGIVAGGALIMIIGMLQLENFLGPLQPVVDALFGKLYALFE